MRAERDNEKVHSRKISALMAVAKARVWASEGWQVVLTDDDGKTFTPADFETLWSFNAERSRQPELHQAKSHEAELHEAELHNAELHGAGEERIGQALLTDTGAGTVAADEADVVAERQE